jgi:methionine-rich copper-binding protein CopC
MKRGCGDSIQGSGKNKGLAMTKASTLLLLGCVLLAAQQARAQCAYDTSTPLDGDILKTLPTPMVINFTTDIHVTGLRLVDADGTEWPVVWTKTDANVFKLEFEPAQALRPGKYQIQWSAYVRQHFHPDGGVINFTIASEGSADVGAAVNPAAAPPAVAWPRAASGLLYRGSQAVAAPPSDR